MEHNHLGFEERVSRNGSFGCGIYFAENAIKSDQYSSSSTSTAGSDALHYMFVSRVVLGNIKVIHQRSELNFNDAKRPPLLYVIIIIIIIIIILLLVAFNLVEIGF